MKVCIVGNSHIAALKLAANAGALGGTGVEAVFFGAPGQRFKKLRCDNGVLSGPRSLERIFLKVSGGRYTQIDPSDFDAVVVYGGGLFLHRLVGSLHRTMNVDGVHLSEACLGKGIERWFTRKHTFRLAKQISRHAKRVLLAPRPCPAMSEMVRKARDGGDELQPWAWQTLDPVFRRFVWEQCEKVVRNHGLEMLFQPETTLDRNQYTDARYTKDSTRLLGVGRKHEDNDVTHMNAAYGHAVFEHMLDQLCGPGRSSGARFGGKERFGSNTRTGSLVGKVKLLAARATLRS